MPLMLTSLYKLQIEKEVLCSIVNINFIIINLKYKKQPGPGATISEICRGPEI